MNVQGLYNNRNLNFNTFKTADFDYAPFVNNVDNIEELILKIVVKNGMKQNYDDMEGIFDDGGAMRIPYQYKGVKDEQQY